MDVNVFDSIAAIFDLQSVEKILQEKLKTSSFLLPSTSAKELSEGRGFRSKIAVVNLDWSDSEDHLPKSCIIKFSAPRRKDKPLPDGFSMETILKSHKELVKLHNRECLIYERMGRHSIFLKCFGSERRSMDTVGFIALEYVPDGCDYEVNDVMPKHAISQVLRALASLHAESSSFSSEEQLQLRDHVYGSLFYWAFEPEMVVKVKEFVEEFSLGRPFEEKSRYFNDVLIDELCQPEYLQFIARTTEELRMQRVLCHGDVWICNMLWKKKREPEKEIQWTLKALIDLQTTHFGNVGTDLAQLLCSSASPEDRRNNWEAYVEEYFKFLKEAWKGELPFSLEQAKEAYCRIVPLASFIVAINVAECGSLLLRKGNREEHQKTLEQLEAKYVTCLDDIIEYQSKVRRHFKQI